MRASIIGAAFVLANPFVLVSPFILASTFILASPFVLAGTTAAWAQTDSIAPPKLLGPTESCVPNENLVREEIEVKREVHVIACYNVGADGTAQNVTIANSDVSHVADQAARDCVSRLRYTPATKNGQPMLFPLVMQFNWCANAFTPHKPACKPLPITAEHRALCQKALSAGAPAQ